jgi:parallel beta-helix repeat protein
MFLLAILSFSTITLSTELGSNDWWQGWNITAWGTPATPTYPFNDGNATADLYANTVDTWYMMNNASLSGTFNTTFSFSGSSCEEATQKYVGFSNTTTGLTFFDTLGYSFCCGCVADEADIYRGGDSLWNEPNCAGTVTNCTDINTFICSGIEDCCTNYGCGYSEGACSGTASIGASCYYEDLCGCGISECIKPLINQFQNITFYHNSTGWFFYKNNNFLTSDTTDWGDGNTWYEGIGMYTGNEDVYSHLAINYTNIFGEAPPPTINISDCSVLNQAGKTYYLTADITNNTANPCMDIQASNITLDCQGHILDGIDQSIDGIEQLSNLGLSNVTITNCNIIDFNEGIYFNYMGNINISYTNVSFCNTGIDFDFNENNTISNSVINSNSIYGFYFENSSNNTIHSNIINDNSEGFELQSSSDNLIFNNILNNTVNIVLDTNDMNNWNTTQQSGTRIFSAGTDIGGNYYTDATSTGYSDTCVDVNTDGFCDLPYDVEALSSCIIGVTCGSNVDYLPLSDKYSGAPTGIEISDCSVLDQPNTTYLLTADIIDSSASTCMDFQADNIILDCQGHTIDGLVVSGHGIFFERVNGTVKNCIIKEWGSGVYFYHNDSSIVENCTIYNNNYRAVIFDSNANYNIVRNSIIKNNTDEGFYITGDYNYIYNNLINQTVVATFWLTPLTYWNITNQTGTNIWNSSLEYIGGNLYTNPSGTGYSDTCNDLNSDGYCDSSYTLTTNNIDYLPLAKTTGQGAVSPYIAVTFNYSEVNFGLLNANTANNSAPNQLDGIYNVSVDTNANYKVEANGTDFSGAGTIPIANLRMDTNSTAGDLTVSDSIPLTTSPQMIDDNIPFADTANYQAYFLTIPSNQPAGDYTTKVTITYSNDV